MWEVKISKKAYKNLLKIPKDYQENILLFIKSLKDSPLPYGYDLKKMKGAENLFRCRIGIYRIVYEIFKDRVIIEVLDINHRKDIYK
jgi:mRNA interferase RelE/StbE